MRRWEDSAVGLSQQPDEAGGSRTLGTQGEVGAAPTTTGRVGTARRPGSGKQDGEAYECRNQWWNPLKWTAGSNLVDVGRSAAACLSTVRAGMFRVGLGLAGPEGTVKGCGVAVSRLQGKSWAPIPSNGQW